MWIFRGSSQCLGPHKDPHTSLYNCGKLRKDLNSDLCYHSRELLGLRCGHQLGPWSLHTGRNNRHICSALLRFDHGCKNTQTPPILEIRSKIFTFLSNEWVFKLPTNTKQHARRVKHIRRREAPDWSVHAKRDLIGRCSIFDPEDNAHHSHWIETLWKHYSKCVYVFLCCVK